MKIRKLQLKNIGVFDDETIEFQPCPAQDKAEIHILTGENGSGKTTILQSLANVFQKSDLQEQAKAEREYVENWGTLVRSAIPKNEEEKKLLEPFTKILKVFESRNIKQQNTFSKPKTSFHKRFRFFEYDGQEEFVFPEEDRFKSQIKVLLNENELIKIYGNPTWWNSVLSHTTSKDIELYQNLVLTEGIPQQTINFAVFAYSGYRRIKDESIEIGKETDENPLYQALEFIKDENSKFTVNQWLGQNLINASLEQTRNKLEEAKKFRKKVQTLEKVINDIVASETKDNEIRFEMQSATKLVLIKNGQELDFDVLPDGLKSLISWIGDLLMRLDSLQWENDTPIFEREIILFLDEIEVHLHPAWQRKVLPIVQKLFKNAQIFVSTHSPFVVNSVDDAWVYKLKVENGKAKIESVTKSEDALSYRYVARNTFDIESEFGIGVEKRLNDFYKERDSFLQGNGNSKKSKAELKKIAKELAKQSTELKRKIEFELFQLSEITGENFDL